MLQKYLTILVILLFFGITIYPTIYADREELSLEPIADLDCYGELDFIWPLPGETIYGMITVENIGDPDSLLDWEVVSYPDWGVWTFDPENGTDLVAGDAVDIHIEILYTGGAPYGEVVIVNSNDPDDYCEVYITISGNPPPPKKIIGFIDSLNISEYFIKFHIILAFGVFYSYFPIPTIRILFNEDFLNSKNYDGFLNETFVWATFYY